ncbi:hypothetical protein [uncultured Paludibaculum sp.]|uniref:hypothetical protein n=1 Tax=uncultured Paludibaculum sp. TaxID=1765020 RepID=UPI002AABEEC8|nr:hypothetical protein [uncultured Paludibaculum sp.]
MQFWRAAGGTAAWTRLLGEPEEAGQWKALRPATYSGKPFGDEAFAGEMRAQRAVVWAKAAGAIAPNGGVEGLRARS